MCVPLLVFAFVAAAQERGAAARAADAAGEVLPLRLEDVVRLVEQHAPAVRQAHLSALASGGGVQEAKGIFDPVFFSDLTYTYAERPTTGGFFVPALHERRWEADQGLRALMLTGATVEVRLTERYSEDNLPPSFFGLNPQSDASLNFAVTQPLLKGGWMLNATQPVRTAELAYDSSIAGVRQSAREAVQAAVDAYWNLAFALADLEVKEFSLKLAEELRAVTEAKFRVGTAAEVDVVQTLADIAVRTDERIRARQAVQLAEDTLRRLIFKLEELEEWRFALQPSSAPPDAVPTELRWEDAVEAARRFRPDLRQARVDLERARLDWEVARRNLMPRLDLAATGTSLGTRRQVPDTMDPVFSFLSAGYSLGLALEIPLGNREFRGAERRTRADYFLALQVLRDREHAVAAEVRDAVRNVNFLAERVKTTIQAREVAERQLEAEQRRLREGASTNFQVLQFQVDLVQALTAEKSSRIEYAKAVTRLNLARGLDWDGAVPEMAELEAYEPRDVPRD